MLIRCYGRTRLDKLRFPQYLTDNCKHAAESRREPRTRACMRINLDPYRLTTSAARAQTTYLHSVKTADDRRSARKRDRKKRGTEKSAKTWKEEKRCGRKKMFPFVFSQSTTIVFFPNNLNLTLSRACVCVLKYRFKLFKWLVNFFKINRTVLCDPNCY